jgi:hypothetical protein
LGKQIFGKLQGGQELSAIAQKDVNLGYLFHKIITAVNYVATAAAVSAVGKMSPPPPVDTISVVGSLNTDTNTITCPSEHLHFTLTHNGAIQKGIQYISEIATEPNFLQPHILDHGCSRSGFISLPTKDANNNTQTYYLRSYAQYHGSDPSAKTVLGGLSGATAIQMTGSSTMSLLPSTGSGTAAPTGQQGGRGLGTVLNRPAPGPKRNLV